MFSHEKLIIYQRALEYLDSIQPIISELPRGYSEINDQLKRASISILLNIAEGAGKSEWKDKQRFYSIARGSTLECAAIIDLIILWNLVEKNQLLIIKRKLYEIASMLSALVIKGKVKLKPKPKEIS